MLLVASVVCAAVAGLVASSGESTSDPGAVKTDTPPGTAEVEAELALLLRPFRRARRPYDSMPDYVVQRLLRYQLEEGENPGRSRRLGLRRPAAYVWPSAHGACYTYEGKAGSGCFPLRVLRELGVALSVGSTGSGKTTRAFAVVRDRIERIAFVLDGGTRLTVPVRRNRMLVILPGRPTTASWVGPNGQRHTQPNLLPPPGEGPDPRRRGPAN